MRYGVLSDIHGNLVALEAALDVLRRERVDAYLCLGDLVGYGPLPNECVDVIVSLDALCVGGNHDLIAADRLDDSRCTEAASRSLRWTRSVLRSDVREYLAALPLRLTLPDGVVIAHGSLDDPEEYTIGSEEAAEQLRRLGRVSADASLLLLGHTHRARAYGEHSGTRSVRPARPVRLESDERWLLNPGSIGQSRERLVRARSLVLDLEQREATFFATRYEVDLCRRQLQTLGLPERSFHVRPRPLGSLRRAVRRVLAHAREQAKRSA